MSVTPRIIQGHVLDTLPVPVAGSAQLVARAVSGSVRLLRGKT